MAWYGLNRTRETKDYIQFQLPSSDSEQKLLLSLLCFSYYYLAGTLLPGILR